MKKTLLTALASLLLLPSAASAATADADIENRQGTRFGPVVFNAARGEVNDVTVTTEDGRMRFHDSANPVDARGDCEQVNARTVSCPTSEDPARVKLGNRGDRAKVEGLVHVLGGPGFDVLRGSAGTDTLNGQRGGDVLRGKAAYDALTGGRGEDVLIGGRGDDDLIDGEGDARAATDIYRGGRSRDTTTTSDRGDIVLYTKRDRGLRVNLGRAQVSAGPEGDDLTGIESIGGGSGDDRLTGDGDDNLLQGNGGDDRLRGRGGADTLDGDDGDDNLGGGGGDDLLVGDDGTDSVRGGDGDDDLISDIDAISETVKCGAGDDFARSTRVDVLEGCEIANSDPLYIQVQPEISGNTATFQVACQRLNGCAGTLELNGPNGEDFGSGAFSDLPDDPETFSPVEVELTPAAVAALQDGVVVQVAHGDTGGYRAFMRAP